MSAAEIRQSFLDFFREKGHTLVPSSSLMPDSPNLLFTNAGMNQFVPIFLGERQADVSTWQGAIPGSNQRAADTQKCIRAGGKHNDLDDVGLDTYHHTFFEMLGNWSFGDYFKREAIDWAWELVVTRWGFPPARIYATIYNPDKSKGDPAERDHEAWELWAEKFRAVGLDPEVQIVNGNKKDNFWMMGETGPCGPCSELHIDLTPEGNSRGSLVNVGTSDCIEIWNLVFIQFNANPDGTFSPLPAQHVDTGMGFERVASIIQGTKQFTDFANAKISNYETDVFRPIFDEIERLTGRKYGCTLPKPNAQGQIIPTTEQEKIDVAFRVIGDHLRTLSFAIADGILPGNSDRNYVLRRILRRGVRYGRTLGFTEPFFAQLVPTLARTMGDIFPELRTRQGVIEQTLRNEEISFNRTLDKGIHLFECEAELLMAKPENERSISGEFAFKMYDEQGFPIDLTELMARERGFAVEREGFETLMEAQRERARRAQKRTVIELSEVESKEPTRFDGFERLELETEVTEVVTIKDRTALVFPTSVCYAEMGGQVGDTATLSGGGGIWRVVNTQKIGNTWLHFLDGPDAPTTGTRVTLTVDAARRRAIERHHTVTHLLHWALHEVASREATQKGSAVNPEKLTFDFNSEPLSAGQLRDIEKLVNERILENAQVSATELPHAAVKGRPDIMQFFGDKYGETVRVVQIGGSPAVLDGYSMELCGGTHTRATGEIGLFRILSEGAIASGVRRIEAVAGLEAYSAARHAADRLETLAERLNSPVGELERKLDATLTQLKELEKLTRSLQQKQAAHTAVELLARAENLPKTRLVAAELDDSSGDEMQAVAEAVKSRFDGVVFLIGAQKETGTVSLVAAVAPGAVSVTQAGKLIQAIAPIVGGKGGCRPDMARGAGKDASKIAEALAKVRELLG
jgi:alanyl-tRNA synthetase